jgi:acetoin utilization protein AcuB
MPFIFIDRGAPAIRQYHEVKGPAVTALSKAASTHKIDPKENQTLPSPYQQRSEASHRVHTAEDIMSSPAYQLDLSEASIEKAWAMLQKFKVKHLPLTKNKKLFGIVSERDILKIYAIKNSDKQHWFQGKVFAASANMDIHQLSNVLFKEKIGSLPIVNDNQEVIGIVTRTDILKLSSQYGPMEFWV